MENTRQAYGVQLPTISVIIPFYKYGQYLQHAINSIRAQDYPASEIIIVDDGSPIPAETFLSSFSDLTIIHTPNRGVSAARNTGAIASVGELLLFLDADDLLCVGALQAHLAAFANSPRASLVFGARREIDEAGHVTRESHVCRERRNYFRTLLHSNPIGGPGAAMIRREAFFAVGGFPEGQAMAEDYDLFLRLALRGSLYRHTFCVTDYRVHHHGVSVAKEKMLLGTMETLDRYDLALSRRDRRILKRGRRRWRHVFFPRSGLAYRMEGWYHSLYAAMELPLATHMLSLLRRFWRDLRNRNVR